MSVVEKEMLQVALQAISDYSIDVIELLFERLNSFVILTAFLLVLVKVVCVVIDNHKSAFKLE